jgi:hypothetical protein
MWLGGIPRDNSRPVLKVSHNEVSFSPRMASYYRDAINATPFLGSPVKTVKVSNIGAKTAYDGNYGLWYWEVDYEFMFDFRTWDSIQMDQGLRRINTTTGKPVPIIDSGEKISEPVMLDGSGQVLPSGGTPVYGAYEIYNILPFTVFVF